MSAPAPLPANREADSDIGTLFERFLRDRGNRTRRGLSEVSKVAYRVDLAGWAQTVVAVTGRGAGPGDAGEDPVRSLRLSDFTVDTMEEAYAVIRETSSASTTQRRLGTMRLFAHYLQARGLLTVDPLLDVQAPVRPKRLPAGWNDDELQALALAASAVPDSGRNDRRRWPARDRALFAVLSSTGVRAGEACAMTDRSVRLEGGGDAMLTIIGKGDQQRNLPLFPEALHALEVYRSQRTALLGPWQDTAPTFVLTNGEPLRTSALNYLVETWIRRANVTKQTGEAAHGFRHTFAKGLMREGVPVPAVQALLGHADLKTTGIYLQATAADVRDAVMRSPARNVLRTTDRNTPPPPA